MIKPYFGGNKLKIALHDSDKTKFPNLALMKLSAFHKSNVDERRCLWWHRE
jgi:hypothetical protein